MGRMRKKLMSGAVTSSALARAMFLTAVLGSFKTGKAHRESCSLSICSWTNSKDPEEEEVTINVMGKAEF